MTPPNTEAEVAKIAKGLTKAQRETMLGMDRQGAWCRPDQRSIAVLKRLTLAESMVSRSILFNRLTPLGLAVRAHLERQP